MKRIWGMAAALILGSLLFGISSYAEENWQKDGTTFTFAPDGSLSPGYPSLMPEKSASLWDYRHDFPGRKVCNPVLRSENERSHCEG